MKQITKSVITIHLYYLRFICSGLTSSSQYLLGCSMSWKSLVQLIAWDWNLPKGTDLILVLTHAGVDQPSTQIAFMSPYDWSQAIWDFFVNTTTHHPICKICLIFNLHPTMKDNLFFNTAMIWSDSTPEYAKNKFYACQVPITLLQARNIVPLVFIQVLNPNCRSWGVKEAQPNADFSNNWFQNLRRLQRQNLHDAQKSPQQSRHGRHLKIIVAQTMPSLRWIETQTTDALGIQFKIMAIALVPTEVNIHKVHIPPWACLSEHNFTTHTS